MLKQLKQLNLQKNMKKIIILFILTIFSTNSFAAGSDSNSTSKVKSNYDKAVTLIKAAKKYEKKGKKVLLFFS